MDDVEVGQSVREARQAAGASGRGVAQSIGLDSGAYTRSEAGQRSFKATELVAIADVLGVGLDDLIQRRAATVVAAERQATDALIDANNSLGDLAERLADADAAGLDISALARSVSSPTVLIGYAGKEANRAARVAAELRDLVARIQVFDGPGKFGGDASAPHIAPSED